jgi:hypothetical protein
MSNPDDPSSLSLDDAITAYVSSEYFTGLSAVTKRKRRGVLRNMRADVLDLFGLPETPLPALALRHTHPVPSQFQLYSGARKKPPDERALRSHTRSAPRRSWTTA